jgi:hypothetical protein
MSIHIESGQTREISRPDKLPQELEETIFLDFGANRLQGHRHFSNLIGLGRNTVVFSFEPNPYAIKITYNIKSKLGTPEKRIASLGSAHQRTRGWRQVEIAVMQQPATELSQAGRCS